MGFAVRILRRFDGYVSLLLAIVGMFSHMLCDAGFYRLSMYRHDFAQARK